jgi:hypothetical protein
MKTKRLTTTGIARILARGIKANFNPENQHAEIARLAEYLQDLAMSRAMEAELTQGRGECQRAEDDADFLDDLASELEATV